MNIGKDKPYAILVFGAPMSGKTTFAEHFSETIGAPFFNFPKLQKSHKCNRKFALELIDIMAKGKSSFVIEGMMDKEAEREEIRKKLSEAGFYTVLVWVQTDLNAIKQRMRHAYHKLSDAKAALADSYKQIEAPADNERPLVISGKHTYQTQCKNVINNLSDYRI